MRGRKRSLFGPATAALLGMLLVAGGGALFSSPGQYISPESPQALLPTHDSAEKTSPATPPTYPIYRLGLNVTTTASKVSMSATGLYFSSLNTSANATAAGFAFSWDPGSLALFRVSSTNVSFGLSGEAYIPTNVTTVLLGFTVSGSTSVRVYRENTQPYALLGTTNLSAGSSLSLDASELEFPSPVLRVNDTLRDATAHQVYAVYYGWYGSTNAWLRGRNGSGSLSVAGEPLQGYYWSQNLSVIDTQIKEAQSAGITAFLESWGQNDSYINQSLQVVFPEAARLGFHIGLYYETLNALVYSNLTYPQALRYFVNGIDWYLATYSSSPAILKVNNTPLIFLWSTDALSAGFWQEAFAEVRQNHSAYFIAETSGNFSAYDVFNGVHEYGVAMKTVEQGLAANFSGANFTDGTLRSYWYMQLEASLHDGLWFAPTEPGFDNQNDPSEMPAYTSRDDGVLYAGTWNAALRSDPDGVTITTWNEWYEGTNIEPAAWTPVAWSSPYQYVDITQCETNRYFANAVNGSDSCAQASMKPPSSSQSFLGSSTFYVLVAGILTGGVLAAVSLRDYRSNSRRATPPAQTSEPTATGMSWGGHSRRKPPRSSP